MPFTVENLIKGQPQPVTASPHEALREALARMIEHDYSQLPVVDEERRVLGMITSDSIVRALHHFGVTTDGLRVADAMLRVGDKRKYRADDDLFDLLDGLNDAYAVLIVDLDGRLVGIVTNYDTTEYFRRRAQDIMFVEDVETTLREFVSLVFTDGSGAIDTVKLGKKPDELTFNDNIKRFLDKDKWPQHASIFHVDPEAISSLLHTVRKTRNNLAHFHEITPQQRDELRFCREWLTSHASAMQRHYHVAVEATPEHSQPATGRADVPGTQGDNAEAIIEEEEPADTQGRFVRLAAYLQARTGTSRIVLTFAEIEKIIGDRLPDAAREHRSWWSNNSSQYAHAQHWLDAGWRVATANVTTTQVVFARIQEQQREYMNFYNALLADLRQAKGFPLKGTNPDGHNRLVVGGVPQGSGQLGDLAFSFAQRRRFRIEIYIDRGDQAHNKAIYGGFWERRAEIEARLESDEPLSWERMEDKRASRITIYHRGSIEDDPKRLDELRQWAAKTMVHFYQVMQPVACQVANEVPMGGSSEESTTE